MRLCVSWQLNLARCGRFAALNNPSRVIARRKQQISKAVLEANDKG